MSIGKHWDNVYRNGPKPWSGMSDWLKDYLIAHEPTPKVALDLGCGIGEKSLWLAEQGFTVTGIDISGEAIHKAESNKKTKDNPVFIVGDVTDKATLDFPPASFGLVLDVLTSALFKAEPQIKLFPRIRKLLVKNGLFIHYRIESTGSNAPDWIKKRTFRSKDFEQNISGFEIIEKLTIPSRKLPETTVYCYVLQCK